jgi:hypothetical protein
MMRKRNQQKGDVMKFVNLTPHAINLKTSSGEVLTIVPQAPAARVSSVVGDFIGEINGVAIHKAPVWGEVEGLPDPAPETIYIVSALVAGRVSRADVVSPGTGPNDGAIRKDGQIVAVTRLISS